MAHPEELRDGERDRNCEEREPCTPGPEHKAEHTCHPHRHHEAVGMHQRKTPRDYARRGHRSDARGIVCRSPLPHHPPPQHPDDHEQGQAEKKTALGGDHRGGHVAPLEMPGVHRVVVRQIPDVRDPTAARCGASISDNEQPADSAAEQDEERRLQRGHAVPCERRGPTMEENDQRNQQHDIFEGDCPFQGQAGAHQLRRNEVDEERIGQARARELRMLRRKISAGRESLDDVDVQRQIVPVDEEPRVDAVGRLVHHGGEDHREREDEQQEEAEAPERGAIATAECSAHARKSGTQVGTCGYPRRPTNEHTQRSDRESGADQQRRPAEAEERRGDKTGEPEHHESEACSRSQTGRQR